MLKNTKYLYHTL